MRLAPRPIGPAAAAAVLALLIAADAAGGADDRPINVLFITSDDLGLQPACYGDPTIATPSIDALAASGVRFEVAYVAQASCSPSRSAMFTGTYPHTNGQLGLVNTGYSLHPEFRERTLPGLLKAAGYRTGIIGKLHVAPEDEFPFDERPRVNTRDVAAVAEAAGSFLESSAGEPFFLMVNYSDPHVSREQGRGPQFFEDQVKGVPPDPLGPGDAPAFGFQGVDDPEQLRRVAGYYNCIKRIDAGLGLLLGRLEDSGRADETLVIFIGDHGPPFARGKTTCYEAGLRIPFIVRWPGVSRTMASPKMVSTVDIVPTVLDAAGLPIPEHVQGRSLRPVLAEPDAPWRDYLAAEFHCHGIRPFYPRRAIRDERYKLIHNLRAGEASPSTGIDGDRAYPKSQEARYDDTAVRRAFATFADPPEFELYDLQSDPDELADLADRPELAEVLGRMKEALLEWRQETEDPFLDPAKVAEYASRAEQG